MVRYKPMIHLSDKKCVACEGGVPPLNEAEIKFYLSQVKDGWEIIENKPGSENATAVSQEAKQENAGGSRISTAWKKIQKEFKFGDFKKAMEFVNKIAVIAEQEGHHPDIYIFYNRVKLELWTHAIGGLSENDFILAAKVDTFDNLSINPDNNSRKD